MLHGQELQSNKRQVIDELHRLSGLVNSWAKTKRHIASVDLFGSRVRGDHRIDSDIDIAVTLIQSNPDSAFAYFSLHHQEWLTELCQMVAPIDVDLQWCHKTATITVNEGVKRSSVRIFP